MSNRGRMVAVAGVGLLAWAVGAARSDSPPPAAPPKAAGPAVARVSGPFTHANLTVFLLHGPDVVAGQKFLTLQEALEQKKAVMHETSQVNELAVENLTEFFQRFRSLNVRSNEQLDNLVAQAQRVVRGVQPQALRDDAPLRQQVATQLAGVQSVLDGLLVDRPRRNILRRAK